MGRYQAKKRQEAKKKATPQRKALEYTTSPGRGKNRVSTKSKTIPADKRPADMKKGVTYGDAGRPYKGPGGNPNGSGQGQAQQAPPAPKLPPKPTSPKTPPKATPPKATPKKESSKKLTPMQQWAKANPGLAKKVKKGQSGYKELKIGRSTKPRSWLDKNYKPGKKK
jgi:hypothetical protein